jgi:hypothetical protein
MAFKTFDPRSWLIKMILASSEERVWLRTI